MAKIYDIKEWWDDIYCRYDQNSVWPWSDLVETVLRNSKPNSGDFKVLELGCGAGANIPFFLSLGVDYYSVEASQIVVSRLRKKFPQVASNLIGGVDFTEHFPKGTFDLIFDRGSMVCNSSDRINNCIRDCYDHLRSGGGMYIGIDWISTQHSSYSLGEVEDEWTRINFPSGPFSDVHRIHFSDKKRLFKLFANFEFLELRHKTITSELDKDHPVSASWNFAAKRK